jgi:hypothetical protein
MPNPGGEPWSRAAAQPASMRGSTQQPTWQRPRCANRHRSRQSRRRAPIRTRSTRLPSTRGIGALRPGKRAAVLRGAPWKRRTRHQASLCPSSVGAVRRPERRARVRVKAPPGSDQSTSLEVQAEGSLAGAKYARRAPRFAPVPELQIERRSSAPAAGEPRGSLDRGMWIALRCDWGWLRRRSCHPVRRQTDAHNDPIPVLLVGDPAGTGICSSPPFDLSDRLITCHEFRIFPSGCRLLDVDQPDSSPA